MVGSFDGVDHVLERSLRPDFALVHAAKGDGYGNLVYRETAMNFSPLAAMCGRVTIAEVEELVEPGELDPGHVQTPGILVQRVVVAVGIEKRIEKRTVSGLNAKNYIPVIDVVRGDGDRGSLRLVERAPRVAVADVVAATGADLRVAPDLAGGGVGHGGAAS